ncbi:MAG TPA: tetratricopeptide repeat protein [Bryobacteraceae bacterium]|nr:tetratricopeptide repeat protein [Bryobacteraceae bacterium]
MSGLTISSARFFGTLVLTGVLMGVLFALDMFLANTVKTESRTEAELLFHEGQRLLQQGDAGHAIDRFREALTIARGERAYQLALADALLAANKTSEAAAETEQILTTDSTNSRANLLLARTLVRQGKVSQAISYYHRAIYGHWDSDAASQKLAVRWELVALLARQSANQELLSELLLLETEAGDKLEMRRRIAHLYLVAGFPERAAQMFRDLLRRNPVDADAYFGRAEAEFSRANYRSACSDFRNAAHLEPPDDDIRKRLNLCDEILTLDPSERRLSAEERSRRSLKLLELSLDSLTKCTAGSPSDALRSSIGRANQALKHSRRSLSPDAVESSLQLAEQLWQKRTKQCGQPAAVGDQALALVLKKAAQ